MYLSNVYTAVLGNELACTISKASGSWRLRLNKERNQESVHRSVGVSGLLKSANRKVWGVLGPGSTLPILPGSPNYWPWPPALLWRGRVFQERRQPLSSNETTAWAQQSWGKRQDSSIKPVPFPNWDSNSVTCSFCYSCLLPLSKPAIDSISYTSCPRVGVGVGGGSERERTLCVCMHVHMCVGRVHLCF